MSQYFFGMASASLFFQRHNSSGGSRIEKTHRRDAETAEDAEKMVKFFSASSAARILKVNGKDIRDCKEHAPAIRIIKTWFS
jgi:hypothetical protein